jgi:hypothetical protein
VDLQSTKGGYFISCESALGVMTGWRTLWEYQTAGFSLRMRRVFIEQCLWFLDRGFSADSVQGKVEHAPRLTKGINTTPWVPKEG